MVFGLRVHRLDVKFVHINLSNCFKSSRCWVMVGAFGVGEKESPLLRRARSVSCKSTELKLCTLKSVLNWLGGLRIKKNFVHFWVM